MSALAPTLSMSGFNAGSVSPRQPLGTTNQGSDSSSPAASSASSLHKTHIPVFSPDSSTSAELPPTDNLSKQLSPAAMVLKNKEFQLQSPLLINGHPPHVTAMTIAGTALTLAVALTVFPVKIVRNLLGGLGAAFLVISYLVGRMRSSKSAHHSSSTPGQRAFSGQP